jgi:hypothetical protein
MTEEPIDERNNKRKSGRPEGDLPRGYVLLVYLGPVVAFGYLVAPVVAGLMRMPISY